jgi:defect-in-organelle-trafficking protein DotD
MKAKIFLIIFLSLLVISCTTMQNKTTAPAPKAVDQKTKTVQTAEHQLAEAAVSIQNSLYELAEIQKAVYPAVRLPDLPDANKIGMGHLASIDWTGPIEPLVRNVAKVTYYNVRVIGKAPAIPILISLSEKNVPIATILRNAAYQAGDRAIIVVYPKSRTIELRYAKV